MSNADVRQAVVDRLGDGPLWTTQLIECLQTEEERRTDPTGDAIKAAIWDLVERRTVDWRPDGRIGLKERAYA